MGMHESMRIAAAGMEVEQARLEATIANVAHARTPRGPDGVLYQPMEVLVETVAAPPASAAASRALGIGDRPSSLPSPRVVGRVPIDAPPRRVQDPGHPAADAQGFVELPAVDPVDSMLGLMEVSRAYEANLRAFDIARSLLQRTLDQWGRS